MSVVADDGIGVVKVEKMRKVTFSRGLPRGTIATFNYEGQKWVAYPQEKFDAIQRVQNRLFATVERVHKDLLSWINAHPENASRVARILERTINAKQLMADAAVAWTMRRDSGGESSEQDEGSAASEDGESGEAVSA